MQAPKLLAEALDLARQLHYQVREEHLEGAGGGHCYFGGKKWILLDVTQSTEEQLADVADALRTDADAPHLAMSPGLAQLVVVSKAA
jgi:hypothetical protein